MPAPLRCVVIITLVSASELSQSSARLTAIKINQYFVMRPKVDQRVGQLSLLHLGMTKTERIELKHKKQ